MNSYTFSGILLAGLALYAFFFFYQHFSHDIGVTNSTPHQAEGRALRQAGDDSSPQ